MKVRNPSKWRVATFLFVAASGACSTAPPASLADRELAHALRGTWCNSSDGGRSCWAYDEFTEDGRFEACGRFEDDDAFRGSGLFTVEGRRMCYVIERATSTFWLPAGAWYCTEILSIGARSHRYRDIDTQQEFELLRVAADRKTCPPTR